jgi:hypothetical protein
MQLVLLPATSTNNCHKAIQFVMLSRLAMCKFYMQFTHILFCQTILILYLNRALCCQDFIYDTITILPIYAVFSGIP